jgi:hypothetical protein
LRQCYKLNSRDSKREPSGPIKSRNFLNMPTDLPFEVFTKIYKFVLVFPFLDLVTAVIYVEE